MDVIAHFLHHGIERRDHQPFVKPCPQGTFAAAQIVEFRFQTFQFGAQIPPPGVDRLAERQFGGRQFVRHLIPFSADTPFLLLHFQQLQQAALGLIDVDNPVVP